MIHWVSTKNVNFNFKINELAKYSGTGIESETGVEIKGPQSTAIKIIYFLFLGVTSGARTLNGGAAFKNWCCGTPV